MTNPSPNASRLRAALEWWRNTAGDDRLPLEADFVTEDPHRYGSLLSDAFIVDAEADGGLTFRFVGTELSDYVGWSLAGQRVDMSGVRKELKLIRDVLARAAETRSPQLASGNIISALGEGSSGFEAICLPLTTSTGSIAFFGAVARAGAWRLPPAPQNHRVDVEAVLDLLSGASGDGNSADEEPPAQRLAANLYPRGA